jgi:site-specific DNA-methyltransferase (adenine-specific)
MNSIVTNEDCMHVMARYPDGYFDLAVVDPPYGIGAASMKMGAGTGKRCSKIKNRKWENKNWDSGVPSPDYFKELFRVSKNAIIWGGNYFDIGPCKHYIIWDKQMTPGMSFADCEMAWTSFDMAPVIFRRSVFLDKKNRFHPTQKPVELYDWIFKKYTTPEFKVLDTHLGSGSSRVAAKKNGLFFVGCEIDSEYFHSQEKRYKDFVSQLTLF